MSEEKESKNVDGPWAKIKNCNSKPLRQPNSSEGDKNLTINLDKSGNADPEMEHKNTFNINDGLVINSKLNVNAAEFIPFSQKNQHNALNESADDALSYLKSELGCLTVNPGKYEEILEGLSEVLKPFQTNENVLKSVTDTILEECIMESNLCYNGARLCNDLYKMFGNAFRKVLLTSCQEEHSQFTSTPAPSDSASLSRICGFGLLLAELFLQIQIEDKCIDVLGEGVLNILHIILHSESEKAIKCVCQVLKLTGIKLDEISEFSQSEMDELFSRLQHISAYPDLDPNLRFIINRVIEMRNSNWGRNKAENSTPEVVPLIAKHYDDPVFFGPDGKVITEEETTFLHENIPLSEDIDDYVCEDGRSDAFMDDEELHCFEEFLKLNEKKENK